MNKEFSYQDKTIFYRATGEGKPLLLIHGFGEDGSIWYKQVEFLCSKMKCIVPDLPGSGRSEMISDMSMEGMAEVMKALLETEGHTPEQTAEAGPAIIGHSMGGYITLALAERHPGYFRSFGLFHSTAYADSDEKKTTRKKAIQFIRQHGAAAFLKTSIPNLFAPESSPALAEEVIRLSNNISSDALVSYYESMMQRPDRTAMLKNSRVPVLFVQGRFDLAVPVNDGLKQCHLPEISYFHLLKNSGHMGMLEEPETTNLILENFLLEN